mmetsp:Transcript_10031/g.13127  ORF Transcript_10031/g.13127 Transcript_10031/m.13127 type:complete len:338 (+) Transcript_10031:121-1134(+)
MSQVIHLAAEDMPSDRMVPRQPVEIRYETDKGEAASQERENSSEEKAENKESEVEQTKSKIVNNPLPPNDAKKVLLHSCCAPCSGAMFEEMLEKGLDVTIFFYNPNIHPRKEYEIRKEENKRYAEKHGVPFVDCDYDASSWYKRMNGMEFEPERGIRCTACFDMRMEVTAKYAFENGFPCFTTTNATSRWKDLDQVNTSGIVAAEKYEGVDYWVYNWQTDEMTLRKYQISADNKFYKQEYCGCAYSLRDSNIWRQNNGIPPVKIGGDSAGLGTRYFENPEADAAEESQEVVDQFFKDALNHFDNDKIKNAYQTRREKRAQVYGDRMKDTNLVSANNW